MPSPNIQGYISRCWVTEIVYHYDGSSYYKSARLMATIPASHVLLAYELHGASSLVRFLYQNFCVALQKYKFSFLKMTFCKVPNECVRHRGE